MNTPPLATLEIETGPTPTASVIWLHGLGADGHDFAPIVQELHLPFPVRYILPHAPVLPVTINGGYRMPAWYDIFSTDITAIEDEAGIRTSEAAIAQLIRQENARGIPTVRILLAGFSQGGAIALHTGIRYPERLGGIIALSTYLPLHQALDAERSIASAGIPIFMGHGNDDDIVLPGHARASRDLLLSKGVPVAWHEYAMPHSVCTQEIADIRRFMADTLGAD